ncbi:stage II sporulation protein R [Sporomusa termitida]|uniref:Stage II sporulation protein R n=1 Tax=Sporomusa termitida TaxID=2377 RepID=A0A517DST5_9FIRM|nr:stage II sporulation protein R [Sporomusa termitida]QDR80397.1 stage II sporulation protein R [Sporomusa termitida]
MRKNLPVKLTLLLLIFCFVAGGWSLLQQQEERGTAVMSSRGDYVRLHILANSDSIKDQRLKLKVRDAVITYLTPYVKDVSDVREANTIIANHQANIIMVAKKVVGENGANYPVAVQMGTFAFPVRSYGSLVLPAGEYQAVRILLGQAAGQNWWCVLFPPLCFIDGANTALAPVSEAKAAEQKGNPVPQIRWKLAELFQ